MGWESILYSIRWFGLFFFSTFSLAMIMLRIGFFTTKLGSKPCKSLAGSEWFSFDYQKEEEKFSLVVFRFFFMLEPWLEPELSRSRCFQSRYTHFIALLK